MKKAVIICAVCFCGIVIFGFLFLTHKIDPVDIVKDHVEDVFEGIECDLSGLEYAVITLSEKTAKIRVSGKIAYEEEVALVMDDGEWVISTLEEVDAIEAKKADKAQENEEAENEAETKEETEVKAETEEETEPDEEKKQGHTAEDSGNDGHSKGGH